MEGDVLPLQLVALEVLVGRVVGEVIGDLVTGEGIDHAVDGDGVFVTEVDGVPVDLDLDVIEGQGAERTGGLTDDLVLETGGEIGGDGGKIEPEFAGDQFVLGIDLRIGLLGLLVLGDPVLLIAVARPGVVDINDVVRVDHGLVALRSGRLQRVGVGVGVLAEEGVGEILARRTALNVENDRIFLVHPGPGDEDMRNALAVDVGTVEVHVHLVERADHRGGIGHVLIGICHHAPQIGGDCRRDVLGGRRLDLAVVGEEGEPFDLPDRDIFRVILDLVVPVRLAGFVINGEEHGSRDHQDRQGDTDNLFRFRHKSEPLACG